MRTRALALCTMHWKRSSSFPFFLSKITRNSSNSFGPSQPRLSEPRRRRSSPHSPSRPRKAGSPRRSRLAWKRGRVSGSCEWTWGSNANQGFQGFQGSGFEGSNQGSKIRSWPPWHLRMYIRHWSEAYTDGMFDTQTLSSIETQSLAHCSGTPLTRASKADLD